MPSRRMPPWPVPTASAPCGPYAGAVTSPSTASTGCDAGERRPVTSQETRRCSRLRDTSVRPSVARSWTAEAGGPARVAPCGTGEPRSAHPCTRPTSSPVYTTPVSGSATTAVVPGAAAAAGEAARARVLAQAPICEPSTARGCRSGPSASRIPYGAEWSSVSAAVASSAADTRTATTWPPAATTARCAASSTTSADTEPYILINGSGTGGFPGANRHRASVPSSVPASSTPADSSTATARTRTRDGNRTRTAARPSSTSCTTTVPASSPEDRGDRADGYGIGHEVCPPGRPWSPPGRPDCPERLCDAPGLSSHRVARAGPVAICGAGIRPLSYPGGGPLA